MDVFNKSFFDAKLKNDEVLNARRQYIEAIYNDMQAEINEYREVQEGILKLVKINEQIWNSSMDSYLPSGP